MENPKVEIKERLKEALKYSGLSPIELSEKTNIPKSSISQYMSGYARPKQDRIYLMSKALGVNEAWLMGYDVPIGNPYIEKFCNIEKAIDTISQTAWKSASYQMLKIYFDSLNEKGREAAIDRMRELACIPEYSDDLEIRNRIAHNMPPFDMTKD